MVYDRSAESVLVNVTADDRYAFVSDEKRQRITVIDLAQARRSRFSPASVVGSIPVGWSPVALTLSPDQRFLYATSQAALASSGWPDECKAQGSDPARSNFFTPQGAIHVVDVARATSDPAHAVIATVPAGCAPVRLAIAPKGDFVYVTARHSDLLLVFDTQKLTADPEHARVAAIPVGVRPVGVAVADGGRLIFVANGNDLREPAERQHVTVIDAARVSEGAAAVIGRVPAGAFPREVHVTADGRTVLVTNHNSNTVQLIDVTRRPWSILVAAAATAQDAPDPGVLVQQGRRLMLQGQHDAAIERYRQALAADPRLFDGHLAMGNVLDLKGDYVEARKHLAQAIEVATDETRSSAESAMAVSYAFEGRAAEAAASYQRVFNRRIAAEQFGEAAAVANAIGRVYLETGDVEGAVGWYKNGYDTARRQPAGPAADLPVWEFRWLHAQGRIAARAGRAGEARQLVAQAEALVARTPSLKDQGPSLAYLAGYVEFHLKNDAAAIAALERADQQDPFILGLLAEAHARAGRADRARAYWREALKSNAHSLQNAFTRGRAVKAEG